MTRSWFAFFMCLALATGARPASLRAQHDAQDQLCPRDVCPLTGDEMYGGARGAPCPQTHDWASDPLAYLAQVAASHLPASDPAHQPPVEDLRAAEPAPPRFWDGYPDYLMGLYPFDYYDDTAELERKDHDGWFSPSAGELAADPAGYDDSYGYEDGYGYGEAYDADSYGYDDSYSDDDGYGYDDSYGYGDYDDSYGAADGHYDGDSSFHAYGAPAPVADGYADDYEAQWDDYHYDAQAGEVNDLYARESDVRGKVQPAEQDYNAAHESWDAEGWHEDADYDYESYGFAAPRRDDTDEQPAADVNNDFSDYGFEPDASEDVAGADDVDGAGDAADWYDDSAYGYDELDGGYEPYDPEAHESDEPSGSVYDPMDDEAYWDEYAPAAEDSPAVDPYELYESDYSDSWYENDAERQDYQPEAPAADQRADDELDYWEEYQDYCDPAWRSQSSSDDASAWDEQAAWEPAEARIDGRAPEEYLPYDAPLAAPYTSQLMPELQLGLQWVRGTTVDIRDWVLESAADGLSQVREFAVEAERRYEESQWDCDTWHDGCYRFDD